MARNAFSGEKLLRIHKENSQSNYIEFLFGSTLPGGDAGEQDGAPIGSLYLYQNGASSSLYQKIASGNSVSDWQENGSSSVSIGQFRPEKVTAATNDTVTAGVARDLVVSPFADDEGTSLVAADFQVGEFIIADADGTPVLLEVTAIAGDSVTFSTPGSAPALADGDTFVIKHYLPDTPADQEGQALAVYSGGLMVKLGDVNWNFANGIQMAAGYAAASGDVSAADTVQSAIQKLDGNNDAQDAVIGTAQGALDLGAFTGAVIPDNTSVKNALQSLETYLEEVDVNVNDLITLSGVAENAQNLGIFTGAIITDNNTIKGALQEIETHAELQDSTIAEIDGNVDDLVLLSGVPENSQDLGIFTGDLLADGLTVKGALQRVENLLDELKMIEVSGITAASTVDSVLASSYQVVKWIVYAFEEATPANRQAFEVLALNDGTSTDDTVVSKLKLGANFNLTISTDVSGGQMRLRAASGTAGVTIRARRIGVLDI